MTLTTPNHTITLPGRVPSKKNSLQRIKRGNRIFTVASDQHRAWHEEQMINVRLQWPRNLTLSKTRAVVITFMAPDKRAADLSNKAEAIMDLLVHAGVLTDDNWFVVPQLQLSLEGVLSGKGRAVVEIFL